MSQFIERYWADRPDLELGVPLAQAKTYFYVGVQTDYGTVWHTASTPAQVALAQSELTQEQLDKAVHPDDAPDEWVAAAALRIWRPRGDDSDLIERYWAQRPDLAIGIPLAQARQYFSDAVKVHYDGGSYWHTLSTKAQKTLAKSELTVEQWQNAKSASQRDPLWTDAYGRQLHVFGPGHPATFFIDEDGDL